MKRQYDRRNTMPFAELDLVKTEASPAEWGAQDKLNATAKQPPQNDADESELVKTE